MNKLESKSVTLIVVGLIALSFLIGGLTGFFIGGVYLKNKVEAEIHAKYESASQSVKDTTVIVKGKAKEIFTEENIDNAKVKLEDAKTSTLSFISDLKEASESKEGEDNE